MVEIVCCYPPNVAKCRCPHVMSVAVVCRRLSWPEWLGSGTIGYVGGLLGF